MQYTAPTITQMLLLPPDLLLQGKHNHNIMGIQDASLLNNTLGGGKKHHILGHQGAPQDQISAGSSGAVKHSVPFNGLSFHNPFDVNLYPLTNPPLYDPTAFPYGGPGGVRRRRISISNGQIGQIVNHEAFYVDDDSVDEYYDDAGQAYRPTNLHAPHQNALHETHPGMHRPGPGGLLDNAQNGLPVGISSGSGTGQLGEPQIIAPSLAINRQTTAPALNLSGHTDQDSVAGVPPQNHTLVYNNEVIYNPNEGPIPGTAAWKKERLLERNRLAASKCRQRKKHAQQQLQNNMAKFEKELSEKQRKLDKAERLIAMYNGALQLFYGGNLEALETLRPLVTQPLDNIEFEE